MPLTAEQLAERRTMLGATDLVVLAGLYPGRHYNACSVYLDKTEERPAPGSEEPDPLDVEDDDLDDEADSERLALAKRIAVSVGHALEPVALDLVKEACRLTLAPTTTIRHPIIPWIGATPDALVVDPENPARCIGVAEAKAVGYVRSRHWGDELDAVPPYVHAQVQAQMTVTGSRVAYVTAIFGTQHRWFRVDHSDDLSTALLEVGDAFWRDHIVPRRMPAPDGSPAAWRMVRAAYPTVRRPELIRPTVAMDEQARAVLAAARARSEAQEAYELEKQRMAALLGDFAGVEGDGYRIRWTERAAYTRHAHEVEIPAARVLRATEIKPRASTPPSTRTKKGEAA